MKFQRQSKILELIEKEQIDTQEDLSRRLKEWGFSTTQATISRDIKELRLVKVMTPDGTYKYASAASENEAGMMGRIRNIFKESVVAINSAQNIVVIKTLPGLGSAAGYAVDALRPAGYCRLHRRRRYGVCRHVLYGKSGDVPGGSAFASQLTGLKEGGFYALSAPY